MHKHTAKVSSPALPFVGAVATRQNPAAHGGVRFLESCSCGASRERLVNGSHVERGAWTS
jgi:hypothetical protein